jgi:cobalt-zinc-cadmium efflux system protein
MQEHPEKTTPASKLRLAIILTASIFFFELIGGILSGSLALIADAMHVLMDVFALSLSLGAIILSQLPSTETKTYGWHRLEILAAIINGLFLVGVSLFIFRKAYSRFLHPQRIEAVSMSIIAALGLVVNFIVLLKLKGPGQDLNLRSAYLHVISDFSSSVAVVIGALIIKWTGILSIDSILSLLIGLVILYGAGRLLNESGHILLEGVPRGIKLEEVASAIRGVKGVLGVHDLHIWSVCSHILSLSCHVDIEDALSEKRDSLVEEITNLLKTRFSISHATIQTDCLSCQKNIISQDLTHRS